MKKYFKIIRPIFFTILATALISCGKNNNDNEAAAKVGQSSLSQKELNQLADSSSYRNFSKPEIINEWIQNEVLFKEAEKNGILKDSQFVRALDLSKKKLAAAFLLQKIFSDFNPNISQKELEDYFNSHKDEFTLPRKAFLINLAAFSYQDVAIQFRNDFLGKNWEQSLFAFKDNKGLVKFENKKLIYFEEADPPGLAEVLNEMVSGEISVILPSGSNTFTVAVLINKFEEGAIPPLDAVISKVKSRLLEFKRTEYLNNYMNKLYSKYAIEIKGEK